MGFSKKNQKRGHGIVEHGSYQYHYSSSSNTNYHLTCRFKKTKLNCPGRATQSVKTRVIEETIPHICNITPAQREKDAAMERLRSLTLSVQGSVRAVELVRSVLKDLSEEALALMPGEVSLVRNVRRWARRNNIPILKHFPDGHGVPEGEDTLEDEVSVDALYPSVNLDSIEGNEDSASNEAVKTGVVYTEPVAAVTGREDMKPSGLIYLKGLIHGHYRAVIEGQIYLWKHRIKGGKLFYECREAKIGCPVTVMVDNVQKKYVLRGTHKHDAKTITKCPTRGGRMPLLKRVDDDGNEIGTATLDEIGSRTLDWSEDVGSSSNPETKSQDISATKSAPPTSVDEVHDFFEDGDDFQMEQEQESEPEGVCNPPPCLPEHNSSHVVITSSNPEIQRSHKKLVHKHAVKSGERCFVCGDELIVSETLASSEETFRKACCYLNVKSEGTWFPRTENSKFYSFCESCTNEIMRIHSLYRKVEEIQSLIFEKVESVEKRIADAEIVDNWMAEAPHSTAVRFEGFRKQVMINYRNKLKLRRAIRVEKKTGNPLMEIQPCSSAHMFAKNPAETNAFSRIIPDSDTSKHSTRTNHVDGEEQTTPPVRRTRGGPKSKKLPEERESETIPTPEPNSDLVFGNSDVEHDNDDFHDEFGDSHDAVSVTSEKEVKFWEDDPSKLEVGRRRSMRRTTNRISDPPEDDDDDDDDEWGDASDPDYEEDEDEEWVERKSKRTRFAKTGPSNKSSGWPSRELEKPDGPREIIIEEENNRRKKKTEHAKPMSKKAVKPKPSSSFNIQFPDAVLRKDGRVFMEGIEIIKNPRGVHKAHPYSVTYTCGACEMTTVGFWKIQNHICGVHLGLYKCHICNKQFSEAKVIDQHIASIHGPGEGKFENCPICEKPVKVYRRSMERHRWSHLSEEEKQDVRYKNWCPSNLRPERQTQPKQSFMCGQCGKTFGLYPAFKRHELTHIPGNELSFICQYCGKTFPKRKGLTQHVGRCSRKAQGIVSLTTYPCPKCPVRFSARATRSKHIRRFHNKLADTELLFSCPKCPRKFNTRTGFRIHKRVCVDGFKGYNSKSLTNPPPSASSSDINLGEHSELKIDTDTTASSSSAMYNQIPSSEVSRSLQYNSTAADAATVLGFNYSFIGDGSNYSESL